MTKSEYFLLPTQFSTILPPECSELFLKHLIGSLILKSADGLLLVLNKFWDQLEQNVTACHDVASPLNSKSDNTPTISIITSS